MSDTKFRIGPSPVWHSVVGDKEQPFDWVRAPKEGDVVTIAPTPEYTRLPGDDVRLASHDSNPSNVGVRISRASLVEIPEEVRYLVTSKPFYRSEDEDFDEESANVGDVFVVKAPVTQDSDGDLTGVVNGRTVALSPLCLTLEADARVAEAESPTEAPYEKALAWLDDEGISLTSSRILSLARLIESQ